MQELQEMAWPDLMHRGVARQRLAIDVAAMVQSASVDTIVSDSGELLYRKCSDGHHHHLVCRRCGTTVEVHDPQVERWADDVATLHGFREVQHNVEIVGLCQACAQDGPAA
ncbi:MAG: transcriptional repressor [Actinobacteria bacterium]|nr:transcriptional repressor [Actinomycetota bacterium]